MNRYIQITIETKDETESDILVARLSQAGFEGFEEEQKKLHAFIPESFYNSALLKKIISELRAATETGDKLFSTRIIEPRNWNADWEKGFDPVVVEDFCAIRAHFHEPIPGILYDLNITPKMSFGTGHHATTYMMITLMRELDFRGKTVLDFGTGTGVLAILSAKMGASMVLAIDSDDWSIENALENIAVNKVENIRIELRDSLEGIGRFDIILANINLRVILENMEILRQHLNLSGVFIGSGVLVSDQERIRIKAVSAGFDLLPGMTKDNWMSFRLKNQESPGAFKQD